MDEAASDEGPSALVQEADCSERVVVLKVRVPGRTSFLLVAAARTGGGAGPSCPGRAPGVWAAISRRARRGSAEGGRAREGEDRGVVGAEGLLRALDGSAGARGRERGRCRPGRARAHRAGRGRGRAGARAQARIPGVGLRCLRVTNGRVVVTDTPLPEEATTFLDAMESDRAALEARGLALAKVLAEDAIELRREELAARAREGPTAHRASGAPPSARTSRRSRPPTDRRAGAVARRRGRARAARGATKLVVDRLVHRRGG